MNKKVKTYISLIVFLWSCFVCTACGQKEDLPGLYIKTRSSSELSEEVKLANYLKVIKTENRYISESAALRSLSINTDGRVVERAQKLTDEIPWSERILVRYAELLFDSRKFSETAQLAEKTPASFSSDDSFLRFLAVKSAAVLEDDAFLEKVLFWFSRYSIDRNHAEFIRSPLFASLPSYIQSLCTLRVYVNDRNYIPALSAAQQLIAFSQEFNHTAMYSRLIFSDIGKAFLYASKDYAEGAQFFEHTARTEGVRAGSHVPFMAYFYAGRLYERSSQVQKALQMYELSFSGAEDEDYDNALWYYLNLMEKVSLPETINLIQQTISSWYDPLYYADLVEKISVRLLTEKRWEDYYRFTLTLIDYADPESHAKAAYISGRLIELDLISYSSTKISGGIPGNSKEDLMQSLYEKAFYGNHVSMYYRVLAAEKLDIPIEDTNDSFFYRKKTDNFTPDTDAEQALLLYAENGFFTECYALFLERSEYISLETASRLASLMAYSGTVDPALYPLSIRLILSAVKSVDTPLSSDVLKNMYPRFYAEDISKACEKYELSEYLMYALVRSESLFDKNVVSHAGAIGLSQLMRPTAGDVARKLKVTEYDLTDAQTNAEFGAFYLKELTGRLEGSVMLSLFSYNAGITRVRSWVRNDSGLPIDLFLETVPYSETRDYGRKILSAAAFYGYLYYGMSTHDVVAMIMH